jgi:hypothetical protein
MKIKIGDYVKVKEGTKDPDFDMFLIGGYQDRVFHIDENPKETLIGIKWDKQTLLKMPEIMRNRCINDYLEYDKMFLLSDEVEIIS